MEGEEHSPKRIRSPTRKKTSLHISGKRLRARAFHKRSALNPFKCLNSVQAPEICTRKTDHFDHGWQNAAKSSEEHIITCHTMRTSIAHPDLGPNLYPALESAYMDNRYGITCPSAFWLCFANGEHLQECGRKEDNKVAMSPWPLPAESPWTGYVASPKAPVTCLLCLDLLQLLPPSLLQAYEDDGFLLLLPSGTAPSLKFHLYLAYAFYTFPFIKLFSNYPIYACHLFTAWTLPDIHI